ncbi:MAG: hypothetical protein IJ736_16230 [Firmicutes bacterium]|nr:hypothetical protein [Bacillota bacterium]
MIYIASALYEEGKSFIEKFRAKKDMTYKRLQVFRGNEAVIIICGTSMIKSAVNVTEVLCKEDIGEKDFFFNIGICGGQRGKTEKGEIYYINKITDMTTGKSYYPSVLYRQEFKEGEIAAYSTEVTDGLIGDISMCDMESAAIYQSAVRFFENDRMIFLKTVSDYCDGNYDIVEIKEIIEKANERIYEWVKRFCCEENNDDERIIDEFCRKMRFNENMTRRAKELLLYYECDGGDIEKFTEEFIKENAIGEISGKREGKEYLDRLERKIIQ